MTTVRTYVRYPVTSLNCTLVMHAINDAGFVDHPYPVSDTLFFKIQGDTTMVKETAKTVKDLSKKHGSTSFAFAASDAEADEMWTNRKYALMSTVAANPGYKCWTTDVW